MSGKPPAEIIRIENYRTPLQRPRPRPRGPFDDCPSCGADLAPRTCDECGGTRFSTGRSGDECLRIGCSSHRIHRRPLRVAHCTPSRRLRSGFLWLRRCREPGSHLHQSCHKCGWQGILLPLLDEAT